VSLDISNWIDGPAPQEGTNNAPFFGRLADYATVPAELLVHAPTSLDFAAASTLTVAGLTAWFAVVELGRVRAGEVVVIQGTGGVSLFAVQFACAHGARVIVVSSSSEKLDRLQKFHPIQGIDRSRQPEWDAQVLEWTGGRGADHILEMAGGDISRTLNALRIGGRISVIGLLADEELRVPILSILLKRAQLIGIGVGHRRSMEDMIRAVDQLKIQPIVDAIYPFAEAPAAFAHVKRGAFGKIVVSLV
jgi:NADPH:quinone reductase-like Zn-dependent oxidoreductase